MLRAQQEGLRQNRCQELRLVAPCGFPPGATFPHEVQEPRFTLPLGIKGFGEVLVAALFIKTKKKTTWKQTRCTIIGDLMNKATAQWSMIQPITVTLLLKLSPQCGIKGLGEGQRDLIISSLHTSVLFKHIFARSFFPSIRK